MNSFCWKCQFKNTPRFLKEKFNAYGNRIFVEECPMNDDRVKGCTTKLFYEIDWKNFCFFMEKHNLLTEEEKIAVAGYIEVSVGDSANISPIS
jgi:hypothetical protein